MCSLKCSPEGKLPLSQPGLPTVSLLRKVICSMLPSYNAGAFPEKAQLCHLSDTEITAADLKIPSPGTITYSFLPGHSSSDGSCPSSSFFDSLLSYITG